MEFPQEAAAEIRAILLSVPGDLDGSGAELRGWLMSAGPEAPWRVLPQAPSEGQGVAGQIALVLPSAAAAVALYDRVRLWLSRRRPRPRPLQMTGIVEIEGRPYAADGTKVHPGQGGGDTAEFDHLAVPGVVVLSAVPEQGIHQAGKGGVRRSRRDGGLRRRR